MTLLHTKGYAEVLESVKMRAQKKAVAMARMAVTMAPRTVMETLPGLTIRELVGAVGEGPEQALTSEEYADISLTFAEDFLHYYRYELDQIRSEKVAAKEKAEVEA